MTDSDDLPGWRRIDRLFERALDLPEAERPAFLDRECAGDAALRQAVEELLRADREADSFLERPARERLSGLAVDAPPLRPGDLVDRYRVVEAIGGGGMGAVYSAVRADDQYQRRVAVKVLRATPLDSDAMRRFRTERQILARLEHPNIARLYDGGATRDGRPYLVMEFVEGLPIDLFAERNRLSLEGRLGLVRATCSAVQCAHQNLLVHRDLKPANILVTPEGVPKLLDFGIAKLLEPGSVVDPLVTRTGTRPMTRGYASPEQVRGDPVTTASDVYGLGVLLYELLAGRPAYPPDCAPYELERLICEEDPPLPSSVASSAAPGRGVGAGEARRLRGDLDNIVRKAMHKEPGRRYASVEQLSEDLGRYLRDLPVSARRDTVRYRLGKFVRRNRPAVALGVAMLTLVAGFLVVVTLQARRLARERSLAETRRLLALEERDKSDQALAVMVDLFRTSAEGATSDFVLSRSDLLDSERPGATVNREDTEAIEPTLVEAIADVYVTLGHYDRALPLLEKAHDLRRRGQEAGDDGPLALNLTRTAEALHFSGRLGEAEQLYRRAATTWNELPGAPVTEQARVLNGLGAVARELWRLDEAGRFHGEALALQRAGLPAGDPEIATTLNYLALLRRRERLYREAESLGREALSIRRAAFGEAHPVTAQAASNLGMLLNDLARFEEAVPLLEQAHRVASEAIHFESPEAAYAMNNLAYALVSAGSLEKAVPLYRGAFAILLQRLGNEHPRTLHVQSNLAAALLARGELDEAERLAGDVLETRRRRFPDLVSEIASSLVRLADVRRRRGDLAGAERLYREALPDLDRRQTAAADAHLGLGRIELSRGDVAKARASLERSIALARAIRPAGHPDLGAIERELGRLPRRRAG